MFSTMEVLQNEWKAKCLARNAAFCQSKGNKWLKRKLEMLTEASDDTAEQKIELEMEITRLESETLEECTQQKEEEDRKKEEARQQKEEARQQKGLCSHVGCLRSVDARGVCKGHGPRCSHE